MTKTTRAIICFSFLLIASCALLSQEEEGDDNSKLNTNLGVPISGHLNPMAKFSNFGLGATAGAGYNFTRRHAFVGEFMWNHLFVNGNALAPIRAALQNPTLGGKGELFSLTGNYRFELRGQTLGTYFIAGGGLYHRDASLSQKVTTGNNITCEPTWEWWGFSCTSGTVGSNQTLRSTSSSALGVNGGIGFTARTGEAPYRVYIETRYHFAPTKSINTQLVVLTIGIRY
jgi:Outer membrane protein beta-barrel domain